MTHKRRILILVLSVGLIFMVKVLDCLPKILPAQTPHILKDLAYDSDKRLGFTVYLPENGQLEPYLVLTKNYAKQGNVLLIRKYVLEVDIQHHATHQNAYYAESIPDRFMNELFIQEYPKALQNKIVNTSINITDKSSWFTHKGSEQIHRKLFTLLEKELGENHPVVSDEKKLAYFSDKRFSRLVARMKDGLPVVWWLRGVDMYRRFNYAACVMDNGYTDYAEVMCELGLRPSLCLPPSTKIAQETIKGQKLYVLKEFQSLKLPRAPLMAEDIGLTGDELIKYYVKHDYLGVEVDIKNPQYGGVLSDSLTVAKGGNVVLRARPFSDGQFEGWYLKDKLISKEKVLTYQVLENETLVAKFVSKNAS